MIVVDRIEGQRAIVEFDGERVDIPAAVLPAGAGEGTVLVLARAPETEARVLREAEARLARLRARSPRKGPVFDL